MASATELTLCPDCGHSIPRDAVRGMCMACMVRGALPGFFDGPEPGAETEARAFCGAWEIIARAGEGAFGLVYEAVQHAPLPRRAALKMLKPGLDSREVMSRFATERETLAMLDHPGIARVLDAGTEDGRPWFAAEWVPGARSITAYCSEQQLPRRERVALFLAVCEAVAHAHQRGIIHRDLKPSNLLVSVDGTAKVIDFGIARATERVLAQSTEVTLAGQVLGTPAYMPPEQAAGHGTEADTRSDIYSLGAVLYELLTGAPLFPRARLESVSLHEALRIVREEAPLKPSAADPSLRGELEWIVLRALEKEPARRYESAAAFSRDLNAWLEGGTVMAAPPGRGYLLRTFLRRHRTAALAVSAVLVSLIAGTAGMTVLWLRAQRSAEAEAAQRQRAESELWQSLVVTAQRERSSPQAGSSGRAMDTVRRAAAIRPGVALRDEVAAALVKPDFGPEERFSWRGKVPRLLKDPVFHPDMSCACLVKTDGSMLLVDVATCATRHSLQGLPLADAGSTPAFSRTGRWLMVLDTAPRAELAQGRFLESSAGRALAGIAGAEAAGNLARAVATPLSSSCNLRLWSVADGSERFLKTAPGVVDCQWSADDSVLALFRSDSVERLAMPEGRSLGHTAIAPGWRGPSLSSDATRMTLGYDRVVELRDAATGALLHQLTHQHTVEHAAWSHDDTLLAVGADDFRIHVWDTATGLKWSECNGHDSRPVGQEFLPGTGLLLTGSWDQTLRLWNPRTGRPQLILPSDGDIWVRNSGGSVVSMDEWPDLKVRRMKQATVLRLATLPTHPADAGAGLQDVAFSEDGSVMFTAGRPGIAAWETRDWKYLGILPCSGGAVAVMPAEKDALFFTDNAGAHRTTWSVAAGGDTIHFAPTASAGPAVFSNHADYQGGWLAVSTVTPKARYGERVELWQRGQFVRGWDFLHKSETPDAFLTSWPSVALSADGRWLATGGSGLCRPLLLRTDAGPLQSAAEARLNTSLFDGAAVAFSPDSRTLAVQSLRAVSLWDVETRTLRHRLPRPAGSLDYLVAFSPDGRLLAAMGAQRDLWLIDPASGERLVILTPPEPAMAGALTFSPDSTLLACALAGGSVQVWHLKELRRKLAAEGLDWP